MSQCVSQRWCGRLPFSLYTGRRHLSAAATAAAAAGLSVAAVGLPGCCHVTPSPLCCLSPSSISSPVSLLLSPSSPRPLCMCLVSCVLPRCHYRAVQITLFSNELSVCSPSALPHPPPASPLPPPPPTPSVLLLKSCPWRSHVTFCAPRHAVPHRCYP